MSLPIHKEYLKTQLQNWKTAILDPAYIIQKATLPTATAQNLGVIYQYIGNASGLTKGGFYECQIVPNTDPVEYAFVEISTKTLTDGVTILTNSDKEIYVPKATSSALGVVKAGDGIDVDSNGVISVVARLEEIDELPTAAAALEGKIYLLTAAQTGYDRGGIYMCEESTETAGTYEWKLISMSPLEAGKGITIEDDVISADTNIFPGTLDEWNALTPTEKAKYDFVASPDEDAFDLTDYQKKDLTTPLTIGGVSQTTVEGALGGLNGLVPSGTSTSNKLVAESGNVRGVSATEITSTGDFNDAIPGTGSNFAVFRCDKNAANSPNLTAGSVVLAAKFTNAYVRQIAYVNVLPAQIYTRTYASGTWSSWEKLATESDLNNYMYQNRTRTNDVLASALNASNPTIFEGSGSSYTGNVPAEGFKYASFIVIPRGGDRFVIGWINGSLAFTNYLTSSSTWRSWTQISNNNYSTSETNTGKTWIDGKPIYRKVVDCGALPNATGLNINHGISNIGNIVSISGTAKGSQTIPIPHVSAGNPVTIGVGSTYISITTVSNMSSYSAYVILEYTKTTD